MNATSSATHTINPLGTDGFEFVEYTAPWPAGIAALKSLFVSLGFAEVAKHKHKQCWLYRQGDINFVVNAEPHSQAEQFASLHGPSVCGMAFRVSDAGKAQQFAIAKGAKPFVGKIGPMELNIPAIYGIGESTLSFVDRYGDKGSIYEVDFVFYPDWQARMAEVDADLIEIDHLTHNVHRGNMDVWSNFYERIGNFREIRYFDIKGEYTGLTSKAMTAPDGKIRIPLNEESKQGGGQIEEYLMQFNGEGIQHIALLSDDLLSSIDKLREMGIPLMTAPNDTYYKMLDERLPGHGENISELQMRGILLDGTTEGDVPRLLLQIFSETILGSPVFFEFIQRKGDYEEGFGEGNFKALFESIERDQVRRGMVGQTEIETEAP